MPILLPVNQAYLDNLIFELKECHSSLSLSYIELISEGGNHTECLENMELLSDFIFYLEMFTLGVHDNEYLHWMKEKAMHLCSFLEQDLSADPIESPILLENGGLILTENGLFYLQQETI